MSELRKEPILQRWVVVANQQETPPRNHCPFCPGGEGETPPEVFAVREKKTRPNTPGWQVRVIPEKYPFLRIEGELDKRALGMYDLMNGIGAHEIVIETPEHMQHWGTMVEAQIAEVFRAYRERMLDLRKDMRFKHIVIVKNHGPSLVAILHPHSHIVAFPVVPKQIDEELRGTFDYHRFHERCIYCDMIREETERGKRMILGTERFLAFAPFASRYPFEVWVIPKGHFPDFGQIGDPELSDLAGLIKKVFFSIKKALNDPPFTFVLHSTPLQEQFQSQYHWHFEIRPRVGSTTGFEWATGFFINTTPPEEATALLRGVVEP